MNDFKDKNDKEFVKVFSSKEIVEGKGKRYQFKDDIDMDVAIFRYEGKLYCVSNICPHKHQPDIYRGLLKNGRVTCPLHGWTYKLKNGEHVNKKQGIKSLKSYEVFEKNDSVYVEKPDLDIPKWRQI